MLFPSFAVAAILSIASANLVKLHAVSSRNRFLGRLIEVEEDGDALKYYCLGAKGSTFYHREDRIVRRNRVSTTNKGMYFANGFLASGDTIKGERILFDDTGVLLTEKNLWACMNVNDTSGNSKTLPMIVYDDQEPNESCERMRIVMDTISEIVRLEAVSKLDGATMGYLFGQACAQDFKCVTIVHGLGQEFIYKVNTIREWYTRGWNSYIGIVGNYLSLSAKANLLPMKFDLLDNLSSDKPMWACLNVQWPYLFPDGPRFFRNQYVVIAGFPSDPSCIPLNIRLHLAANNSPRVRSRPP